MKKSCTKCKKSKPMYGIKIPSRCRRCKTEEMKLFHKNACTICMKKISSVHKDKCSWCIDLEETAVETLLILNELY